MASWFTRRSNLRVNISKQQSELGQTQHNILSSPLPTTTRSTLLQSNPPPPTASPSYPPMAHARQTSPTHSPSSSPQTSPLKPPPPPPPTPSSAPRPQNPAPRPSLDFPADTHRPSACTRPRSRLPRAARGNAQRAESAPARARGCCWRPAWRTRRSGWRRRSRRCGWATRRCARYRCGRRRG